MYRKLMSKNDEDKDSDDFDFFKTGKLGKDGIYLVFKNYIN